MGDNTTTKKNEIDPQQALQILIDGNERFASGLRSIEPMLSTMRLKELAANGQTPFATILTCSDSRIPTETIFDQGVGDLFVVRLVGNIISSFAIASIEFAAMSFETSLVIVMGHSACGAIRTGIEREVQGIKPQTSHLNRLARRIRPAVTRALTDHPGIAGEPLMIAATQNNVDLAVNTIHKHSPTIRGLHDQGKIQVVGAYYDLDTGQVKFTGTEEMAVRQARRQKVLRAA